MDGWHRQFQGMSSFPACPYQPDIPGSEPMVAIEQSGLYIDGGLPCSHADVVQSHDGMAPDHVMAFCANVSGMQVIPGEMYPSRCRRPLEGKRTQIQGMDADHG